jgi:hypothetical protein
MGITAARLKPGRAWPFLLGLGLGAAIWILSPVMTGQREPWDVEGGYYPGALLTAGFLGGIFAPGHWGGVVAGVFTGQLLVLLAGVLADPASGGLWPLGASFLGLYSVLVLLGTSVGSGVRRVLGRRGDSPSP